MKREKAIEILKEQKLFTPLGQAAVVAIDAINNQIAKKVIEISLTHEGYVGKCPTCNKYIKYKENSRFCNHENCGQKLKWDGI